MDTIILSAPDTGEEIEVYVLEQTCIGNVNYLLVTKEEEADSDAWILREMSEQGDESVYEFVEEEEEFNAIAGVFAEILEDMSIEK